MLHWSMFNWASCYGGRQTHCRVGVRQRYKSKSNFFDRTKNRKRRKRKSYREKQKVKKLSLKDQEKLKWEKPGWVRKRCMRIYQYDKAVLHRIAQLGTCPTARGSFIPTARIAPHIVYFG